MLPHWAPVTLTGWVSLGGVPRTHMISSWKGLRISPCASLQPPRLHRLAPALARARLCGILVRGLRLLLGAGVLSALPSPALSAAECESGVLHTDLCHQSW